MERIKDPVSRDFTILVDHFSKKSQIPANLFLSYLHYRLWKVELNQAKAIAQANGNLSVLFESRDPSAVEQAKAILASNKQIVEHMEAEVARQASELSTCLDAFFAEEGLSREGTN